MFLKDFWKLGERLLMWLNKLKIAIVDKNTDTLNELLDDIPTFENKKDIEEAMYLLKEANKLLQTLKKETLSSMEHIKKNIEFLGSETQTTGRLDIKL